MCGTYGLGTMGVSALVSHMTRSERHKALMAELRDQQEANREHFTDSVSTNAADVTNSVPQEHSPSNSVKKPLSELADSRAAEIYYALYVVGSDQSFRATQEPSALFSLMFPDSKIALVFSSSKTKTMYNIKFGIAKFVAAKFQDTFKKTRFYTICFDESMNIQVQVNQMDIHIRYIDNNNLSQTQHMTSFALGHSTAEDLLEKIWGMFDSEVNSGPLSPEKVVQLSMDGPNVNWKLFALLKKRFQRDPNCSVPVEVGSCPLHTIHNAFKTAFKKDWKLLKLLVSYYLFHDAPARREDYLRLNRDCDFPLKCCLTRWAENRQVVQRLIEIWPAITLYIAKQKSLPSYQEP